MATSPEPRRRQSEAAFALAECGATTGRPFSFLNQNCRVLLKVIGQQVVEGVIFSPQPARLNKEGLHSDGKEFFRRLRTIRVEKCFGSAVQCVAESVKGVT